jgi:hypothetical protein
MRLEIFQHQCEATDVFAINSYAYVVGWDSELKVLDISIPSSPQLVDYYELPDYGYGVFVDDSSIYVAASESGLQIFKNTFVSVRETKKMVTECTLYPLQNPIRGDYIELELSLAKRESVELNLYDLLGRRIRNYPLGHLSAGRQRVKLDVSGLPSGTYFLKTKNGFLNKTGKMVLIK